LIVPSYLALYASKSAVNYLSLAAEDLVSAASSS